MGYLLENELIFASCRLNHDEAEIDELKSLLGQRLDWRYIEERVKLEGLSGLLFHSLDRLREDGRIPSEAILSLEGDYHSNIASYLQSQKELVAVLKSLNDHHIPAILFRSILLVELVYRNPGLREFSDIDLMVKEEDLSKAREIFHHLGYSPILAHYPSFLAKGNMFFDLHCDPANITRIKSRKFAIKADLTSIWQRAQLLKLDGQPILTLDLYDEIIFLSLHLLKHSYQKLIWAVDIAEIIRRFKGQLDWELLANRAKQHNLSLPLYYALNFTKLKLKTPIPESILLELKPTRENFIHQQIFKLLLEGKRVNKFSELFYFGMIKRWSEKMRFAREIVFPRREIRIQITRDRSLPWNFLFYPFRIIQMSIFLLNLGSKIGLRLLKWVTLFKRRT